MELFSWIELFFIFSSIILLGYYLFFWRKLAIYSSLKNESSHLPAVSVVICAKNEEKNLSQFLPEIMSQEYPQYEVIVVDDCSLDRSLDVLQQFKNQYNNLIVYTFDKEKQSFGKKEVLEYGIEKSKFDYLVLTDADCKPNSKKWLQGMVNGFLDGSEIVLGVGQYQKEKTIINDLIQMDTGFIAMNYLSFALAGFPYMSVGRNVAYKKDLFFKVGGFKSHYDITSGDDDLFVNQISKHTKPSIVFSSDYQTTSIPKESLKSFFLQKVRHVSAGVKYNKKNTALLSLFYSLSVVWYLVLPFVLCSSKQLFVISTIIILKKLIMYSLIRRIFSKIEVSTKSAMLLFVEFFSVFFHSFAVIVTIFKSKKGKW
ncbi:MAG: hypothetical protein CMP67_11110 [Flavobacteriales bacterium]|nr:hypothetical protein [Flavobacteriales bacterium]|tara:strand:+ start:4327 stop:5436 length:1110 start_codon:yes stop_codon:yes gene_type:complete